MPVELHVDGRAVRVEDERLTLLEVLREQLGITAVKDGCSPQGQCGCCTVLIDGAPRVACVTPVRRLAGRQVVTFDGLDPEQADRWADAFVDTGASQCGFCSPGIIVRLVAEAAKESRGATPQPEQALLAHVCRCTGWLPILDAFAQVTAPPPDGAAVAVPLPRSGRDLDRAAQRATLEGHTAQRVGPEVSRGRAGFADDTVPPDALVAVPDGQGGWAVGETLREARVRAGKIQGRRSTVAARLPVALPPGDWDRVLQTSWVEPAYVETDASWCVPDGEPATALANGGAFGAKRHSPAAEAARRLAHQHGRAVRVVFSREDTVRLGPKRPPLAAGIDRRAGRVAVRVARCPGVVERLRIGLGADLADALDIVEVDIAGPATSIELRAAGWAEGVALRAALLDRLDPVRQPGGGLASVDFTLDAGFDVHVEAGDPLDEVVLRSYCVGAVHMAASWVSSESLNVREDGTIDDLTVRSFGVLRAIDMAPVRTDIAAAPLGAPPLAVSDAVFAATAAALWAAQGWAPSWPTGIAVR